MDCKFIVENISDCIEGLLSPQETERLNRHLETCSECRQLLADLDRDRALLKGLDELPVPLELKGLVRGKIAALPLQVREPAWRFFLPRLAPVAAAVIVTVMGTSFAPAFMSKGPLLQSQAPDEAPRMMMEATEAPAPRSAAGNGSDKADSVDAADDIAEIPTDTTEVKMSVMTATNGDDEERFVDPPREVPLWVKTSVGGTAIFVLWGGVVYLWYIKQQKP